MKKLGKLQINYEKILKNEDLPKLKGGDGDFFYCVCGFCPDFYGDCNPVWAPNVEAALQEYNQFCNGYGVSCRGDGCPQWFCP